MGMCWTKLKTRWMKWAKSNLDSSVLLRKMSYTGLLLLPVLFLLLGCQPVPVPTATAPVFSSRLPLVVSTLGATLTPFEPLSPTRIATLTVPVTSTPAASPTVQPSPTRLPRIKLLFTGVIVPARCVQAGIDARDNPEYLYDEVRETIQKADLAVGTLNATISDYPPHTGCVVTLVLVGGGSNADALKNAGFDVMSVATNHIKNCDSWDCGDRAFLDTLENLRRVGIVPVGAGKNLAQAMKPVVMTVKGVRFGIVSLGMINSTAFATGKTPGIAVLDDENLRIAIAKARKVSDVVIAMPHMGPEDESQPTDYQQHYARVAVEAGADLVVGNHTHVVQGLQTIKGVPVFYGLGNFVFDQTWALDHQQGVILEVIFEGSKYRNYRLIPTHVDGDGLVHIAGEQESAEVLQRIQDASDGLPGD